MSNELYAYIPGKRNAESVVSRETGKCWFSNDTMATLTEKHPNILFLTVEELCKEIEKVVVTKPRRSSKEEFFEFLYVLPPDNWANRGNEESFALSERTNMHLTRVFVRLGREYYTWTDSCLLSHEKLVQKVKESQEYKDNYKRHAYTSISLNSPHMFKDAFPKKENFWDLFFYLFTQNS